jgi:hypothetical protein
LGASTKKPLPEKRLNSSDAIALIFQKCSSAGVGTENWFYPIRLPGFHRAGPSTPLDEHRGAMDLVKTLNIIA